MNAITNFEAETPLVEIEIGGELQLGVDARSLHKTLGSKQDFSTWIKRRISQCQFRENFDFILLHQKVEQVSGTKHLVEYIVTADMAKHFKDIKSANTLFSKKRLLEVLLIVFRLKSERRCSILSNSMRHYRMQQDSCLWVVNKLSLNY